MNIKIIVQSLFFINVVFCQKAFITQTNSQYCSGMYNKRDWSGKIDPYIKLDLEQFKYNGEHSATTAADVSVLIFEYRDLPLLGKIDNTGRIRYVCDQEMVNIGACTEDELNNFLTGDDSDNSKSKILIIKLTDLGDNDVAYNIVNTGYYCVATYSPAQASTGGSMFNSYKIKVNFQNSFGSLAASEIPKLPLYGLLAVVYAVFFSVYLFHVYKHRAELLLLQKYLAGFFAFLTVETILIWSLYEIRNNNKKYPLPGGIKFYITIVSLLNAFKLSFSLFLLLIISLGYGVVYPKLNKSLMLKCKILTGVNFVFSSMFITFSYFRSQSQPNSATTAYKGDSGAIWILLLTIPIICTLAAFYFLILSSLSKTVKYLADNRQIVKLNMYKRLFRVMLLSSVLLLLALVFSTVFVFGDSVIESIERIWKYDKVITDFWPSVLYFVIFLAIAFIWRPTDTSYMLAVSSQLPNEVLDEENSPDVPNNGTTFGTGEEFEIDDLDNPFADRNKPDVEPPSYDTLDNDSIEFDADQELHKGPKSDNSTVVASNFSSNEGPSQAAVSEELFQLEDEEEEADKLKR
ncbi:uncharacterized protein PAS_chr3_1095 [Komagataella phaffii GS115]|uniref:Membrane protein PTM1 n=2 Tax=Komagataella phaffii TaxID=460519 RepID=C4R6H5_KOMPG|nr:uncharacterized protein PAS_chr3_1095 [Komagataella phaffii GS115]AOA63234.1 GQ67_04233T0 [Komagataella phaffii]AOA68694.1 GQ68_04205T0 [Komagataella phaffii GS115]CAY71161.1 Protein of unknown function, copurifies with late Golgi vesicles containing the v-SNARE Tlg2p [Komagataella phaffii GS115]